MDNGYYKIPIKKNLTKLQKYSIDVTFFPTYVYMYTYKCVIYTYKYIYNIYTNLYLKVSIYIINKIYKNIMD